MIEKKIKLIVIQFPDPESCDYYFPTREDYDNRIMGILKENNYDLITKTFGFGDDVTNLDRAFKIAIDNEKPPHYAPIVSTPKMLVARNVTTANYIFGGMYDGSSVLKTISPQLFHYCPSLKVAEGCFEDCASLTDIPSELFKYSINVINLDGSFPYCSSITTIPSTLFENCENLLQVFGLFQHAAITTIPKDLFANCHKMKSIGYSFCETEIETIPEGLFDSLTELVECTNVFSYCHSLTTVPVNLFENNREVNDFDGTFSYCENLTSAVPVVWDTEKYPKLGIKYDGDDKEADLNYEPSPYGLRDYIYESFNVANYDDAPEYCK